MIISNLSRKTVKFLSYGVGVYATILDFTIRIVIVIVNIVVVVAEGIVVKAAFLV